jgi:hypothetical protein
LLNVESKAEIAVFSNAHAGAELRGSNTRNTTLGNSPTDKDWVMPSYSLDGIVRAF